MQKMFMMGLNVYLFALVIAVQEIHTPTTVVFRQAAVVSHDAPTDSRGCHKGPDGKIHCH